MLNVFSRALLGRLFELLIILCAVISPQVNSEVVIGIETDFSDVPVGISEQRVIWGFSANIPKSYTARMLPGEDPAFTILQAGCASDQCSLTVMFAPTEARAYYAMGEGHFSVLPDPDSGAPGLDERHVIQLRGRGISTFDLVLSGVEVYQNGHPTYVIQPGIPAEVRVFGFANGILPSDTRTATLRLAAGGQSFSQEIALGTLAGGPSPKATFQITFGPHEVGIQDLTATLAPNNSYSEVNFQNNTVTAEVEVESSDQLDLVMTDIILKDSIVNENGEAIVRPGRIQADLKISGSGFSPNENRNAVVTLKVDNLPPFNQTVSLAQIAAHGSVVVPFFIDADHTYVGRHQVRASIAEGNVFNENTFYNNTFHLNVQLQCSVDTKGKLPAFRAQGGGNWGLDPYDHSAIKPNTNRPFNMGEKGCAVTTAAMLLDSYGMNVNIQNQVITPGILNQDLKNWGATAANTKGNGFTDNGSVVWQSVVELSRQGYIKKCVASGNQEFACFLESLSKIAFKGIQDDNRATINEQICAGNPVILNVPSRFNGQNDHFVLATETAYDPETDVQSFKIFDPDSDRLPSGTQSGEGILLVSRYEGIKGTRLFKPMLDPAMVLVTGSENIDFIITDPQGRRSGYNPITNQTFNEIPEAKYFVEGIGIASATGDDVLYVAPKERQFWSTNALDGDYNVEIFGRTTGRYSLSFAGFDQNGQFNGKSTLDGIATAGSSTEISFAHSLEALPKLNADLMISRSDLDFDRRKNEFSIKVTGTLDPYDPLMKKLSLDSSVQIIVGGLSGANELIPASAFRKSAHKHETIYTYKSPDNAVKVEISSRGGFSLELDGLDLSDIQPNAINSLRLRVDTIAGEGIIKKNSSCIHHKPHRRHWGPYRSKHRSHR